ncbi:hypothetical protein OH76DRAFT_794168 [Lentinus brumalis]|uniref:Uncharacterized protein n=1 Tax=Lentinus brumalis TaxID=2498619 RepID=A0A371D3L6_9APHY|nr:hypothetical protein OH76DRAFT_794168 [Polyporus brumalis]
MHLDLSQRRRRRHPRHRRRKPAHAHRPRTDNPLCIIRQPTRCARCASGMYAGAGLLLQGGKLPDERLEHGVRGGRVAVRSGCGGRQCGVCRRPGVVGCAARIRRRGCQCSGSSFYCPLPLRTLTRAIASCAPVVSPPP